MRGTGLEALGNGMQGLGEAGARFAISQDERQDHLDKLYARNLALEYSSTVKPVVSEYSTLEGANAVSAWQDTQSKVDETSKAILARASNPRMRSYAQQLIGSAQAEFSDSIVGHSQKQQKVMADATYTAERDTALSDSANFELSDPAKATERMGAARVAHDRLAFMHGWTKPQADLEWQGKVDGVHNAVIEQAIATDNVDAASAHLAKHQGEMSIDARNKAIKALQSPLEARQDQADYATISSGPIPKTAEGTVPRQEPARIEAGVYHPPVAGRVSNTYAQHLARGSAGYDIAAPAGSAIHPIAGGTVVGIHPSPDGRGGKYVTVQHPDGHTSSYMHMSSISVQKGDVLDGSSVIGTVGMTGHATGPHVHLQVKDSAGKQVDPAYLLGTRAAGGTANVHAVIGSPDTPRRLDKAALYASIDSQAGWSPERKERVRKEVDRRVSAADSLLDRQHEDAADAAYNVVAGLGDKGFTDVSKIPAGIRAGLKGSTLITLQNMADTNRKALQTGSEVKPNSPDVIMLNRTRFLDPEGFKKLQLGQYVGKISKAELDTFSSQQAQMMAAKPADWSPRSGIVTALSYGQKMNAIKLKPQEEAAALQIMEEEANRLYHVKKQPLTDQDYAGLFASATRKITTHGVFGGHGEIPRYQLSDSNIPATAVTRITAKIRRERGRDPQPGEVAQIFRLEAH